jgi:hypothetical protein
MAGNSDELYDCDFSTSHRLQLVSSPMLDQLRHRWDRKYPHPAEEHHSSLTLYCSREPHWRVLNLGQPVLFVTHF